MTVLRGLAALLAALLPMTGAGAIARWDGLPAFDPLHVAGAYAGERVCPMCRHGYDAGIVAFVPAAMPVRAAAEWTEALAPAALGVTDPRFRIFVVVAGPAPAPELVRTLAGGRDDPRWFVATLDGPELAEAERDFGRPLAAAAWGYVFAQRRLIAAFSADDTDGLPDAAGYAVRFLDLTNPAVPPGTDPEAVKLALWAAPDHLETTLPVVAAPAAALCLSDGDRRPLADALVYAAPDAGDAACGSAGLFQRRAVRQRWLRTDAAGCIAITAAPTASDRAWSVGDRLALAAYRIGDAPVFARLAVPADTTPVVLAPATAACPPPAGSAP